jgi:hypothetical protein
LYIGLGHNRDFLEVCIRLGLLIASISILKGL